MGAVGAERQTISAPRAIISFFMSLPLVRKMSHAVMKEYLLGPIRVTTPSDNQHVNGLGNLLGFAQEIEFRSPKRSGLSFLVCRSGENDSFIAHLGRELDSEMTESADTNYADAISWFGGADEGTIDGATGTLERSCVLRGEIVRNLVNVRLNTDI
jgi:hypothetical protein